MNEFLPKGGATEYFKTSDGVRVRYGVFPADGLAIGTVLLINGHREFIEKYSEFIDDFRQRGFHVFTMDHRGQGLSDRALKNRKKSHNPNFERIILDIHEVVEEVVRPAELGLPVFLVAHSWGAHLAIRYLHKFPNVVDKAVLLSPMTDLDHHGFFYIFFAKIYFSVMFFLGFSKAFAPGQVRRRSMINHNETIKVLTHDKERYEKGQAALDYNPELFVGGVTFGWIKGALDSIKKIKSEGFMEKIITPTLFLLSGDEKVVNNKTTLRLITRLKNVNVATIIDAKHEIYRETDLYRDQMWKQINKFLFD